MANTPANIKLWDMCVARAKAKFRTYPCPAASHWVHQQYTQAGGQFVNSKKDDDEHKDGKKPAPKDDKDKK
jgi:hypothetical protein